MYFRRSLLFLPRSGDYEASCGLPKRELQGEFHSYCMAPENQVHSTVGFGNRSNQNGILGEHGGLGAPAPLNPPCSLQEQQGVLGIISYHWISIRIQLIAFN